MDAKMVYIEDYVRSHRTFSFRSLLEKQHSKVEIIVTFMVNSGDDETGTDWNCPGASF